MVMSKKETRAGVSFFYFPRIFKFYWPASILLFCPRRFVKMALYLDIGQMSLDRQSSERRGAKMLEKLAKGLRPAFPDMKGF